ncbi:MAG TPA: cupin domain-containing protein [Nocardioidaceae bacterium]|nr:cupin domain-containing protein [Nocardioidaceae bacterium]
MHHSDPERLTGLLSLEDVDHLLTSTALRTPALRIARDGTVLPGSAYTRSVSLAGQPMAGLVDGRKAIALFEDGASLVLQGLQRYWPPLADLVATLERALGHPCQANAYLTPAQSQGFARHSDSHDVFVFQTHGRKRWEVHDSSGPREVLMEPGVCMYLPTGTPHAARAMAEASLHVTLGINRVTWRQLLTRIAGDALHDERFDAPLPAGYLDDPGRLAGPLADHLQQLTTRLDHQQPDALASDQVSRFLTTRHPPLRGALRDRLRLQEITDTSVLVRRPGTPCVLEATGDRLRVLLGDREVRMPHRLRSPMEFVRDHERLRPADLAAWLDPESRLVLTRRLVREGLLGLDE